MRLGLSCDGPMLGISGYWAMPRMFSRLSPRYQKLWGWKWSYGNRVWEYEVTLYWNKSWRVIISYAKDLGKYLEGWVNSSTIHGIELENVGGVDRDDILNFATAKTVEIEVCCTCIILTTPPSQSVTHASESSHFVFQHSFNVHSYSKISHRHILTVIKTVRMSRSWHITLSVPRGLRRRQSLQPRAEITASPFCLYFDQLAYPCGEKGTFCDIIPEVPGYGEVVSVGMRGWDIVGRGLRLETLFALPLWWDIASKRRMLR